MKKSPLSKIQAEPATVRGAIVAALTILGALGVSWATDPSDEVITAIVVLAGLLIPLAQALWTRQAVTPNAKVITRVTTKGKVVSGEAAELATETPLPVTDETGSAPVVPPVRVNPDLVVDA